VTAPRRLLTVGHSYAVALNRRLADEMARAGAGRWDVVAAAPQFVHGDLRPIALEPAPGEACRVEPLPAFFTRRTHLLCYGRRLRSLLREPWDLVHCWEEPYVLAGFQIGWWTPARVPVVFWTAQNLPKRYPPPFSWFEQYCLDRCAGWLACGEEVVAALGPRGYAAKPHRVMPLGVDVEAFRPDARARAVVRQRLGWLDDGPPVIGYLGRFVPEKGVPLLLRAIDRLRTPWRALFVGGGPLEAGLRQWAATHGDRVRICTGVPHAAVAEHLNAMDLLAAPSQTTRRWKEQLGRMLIEAFACGVPVVGSDSGEIPHVIGAAGLVVGERDEPGWAGAIGSLLESPARRSDLAARGRDRAVEHYAWPVIARQHLEFFDSVLDRPAGTRSARSSVTIPRTRRLLTVGHSYVLGVNRRLAHAMADAGAGRWDVTIAAPTYFHGRHDIRPVALDSAPGEPHLSVPLRAYLTRSVHLFCYGRRLRHLLHDDWDLVHCWEEPYVLAGFQVGAWTPAGVPFVFRTAQSLDKTYPPPFGWMERTTVRRAAGWICSGQTVADNLSRRTGYAERPMARIPLGVDLELFRPDRSAGRAVLRQLGWDPAGPPVVGFLGRLTAMKGIPLLMRALDRLGTGWRALFVGAGALEPELRRWAAAHGDRVRICTDVRHDDVAGYVNAMDVLAAPSQTTPQWREQFGRMIIEAFACGVPVVGSDSGEIPYVIEDAGVVVKEGDEPGWTAAIGELLDSPGKRSELAARGLTRAVELFAWPVVARQHLAFFEQLLARR
jgi:glycosyltransferase involved in cell wall biosynthesis